MRGPWVFALLIWVVLCVVVRVLHAQVGREAVGPGGVMLIEGEGGDIVVDGVDGRRYTLSFGSPVYGD